MNPTFLHKHKYFKVFQSSMPNSHVINLITTPRTQLLYKTTQPESPGQKEATDLWMYAISCCLQLGEEDRTEDEDAEAIFLKFHHG